MLDVGLAVALVWAFAAALRVRAWREGGLVALLAYVLALEVCSGITVRGQGPLLLHYAMLLVFLGPSAMPRGPLPAVPLAATVIAWPLLVRVASCLAAAASARLVLGRANVLPGHSEALVRTQRLFRALLLLAVLHGMVVVELAWPVVLGWEGDG
jgi:hypothetical protein